MSFYEQLMERIIPYLEKEHSHLRSEANERIKKGLGSNAKELSDNEWNYALKSKAFDVARNLLPQNMTTSFGMTINTRRFQDVVTEWQSSPYQEMQVLGRVAQLEARKISPVMMKYGDFSEYYANLPDKRRELFRELIGNPENLRPAYSQREISTKLIAVTPEIEDLVLASILLQGNSSLSLEQLIKKVKQLTLEQRKKIAKTELEEKKNYEIYPKTGEIGSFTFEREYAIGDFRDLQRQRGDKQQCPPYEVIGYMMLKEIESVGLAKGYMQIMEKVKDVYLQLKNEGYEYAAEYALSMGNMVRHVTTKDPVQGFYEAKLRTQAAGIDGYRKIAQDEIKIMLKHMPSFEGLVSFDDNYYPLGRLEETVNNIIRKEIIA